MPATCMRHANKESCEVYCGVWRRKRAGEGGGDKAGEEGRRLRAGADGTRAPGSGKVEGELEGCLANCSAKCKQGG